MLPVLTMWYSRLLGLVMVVSAPPIVKKHTHACVGELSNVLDVQQFVATELKGEYASTFDCFRYAKLRNSVLFGTLQLANAPIEYDVAAAIATVHVDGPNLTLLHISTRPVDFSNVDQSIITLLAYVWPPSVSVNLLVFPK